MKRFLSIFLAFRGLVKRPLRALLTTGGIVLGVGMIVAVLSLSATLLGGFNDLFGTVYGRTDVVVTRDIGEGQPLPFDAKVLTTVRATPGVDKSGTTGMIGGTAQLVDAQGHVREGSDSIIYLGGFEQGKLDAVSDYTMTAGTPASTFGEITLEDGWAHDRGFGVGDTIRTALPPAFAPTRSSGSSASHVRSTSAGSRSPRSPCRTRSSRSRCRGCSTRSTSAQPTAATLRH